MKKRQTRQPVAYFQRFSSVVKNTYICIHCMYICTFLGKNRIWEFKSHLYMLITVVMCVSFCLWVLLGFNRAVCVSSRRFVSADEMMSLIFSLLSALLRVDNLQSAIVFQRQLWSDAQLGCLQLIIEDDGDLSSASVLSGPPQFVNHMKEASQENEIDFTERVIKHGSCNF